MVQAQVLIAVFLIVTIVGMSVSLVVVDLVLSETVRDENIDTSRFGRAVARSIFLEVTSAVEGAALITGMVHGMVPSLPVAPASANSTVPTAVMQRAWFELSTLIGILEIALYPADTRSQEYPAAMSDSLSVTAAIAPTVISRLKNSSTTTAIGPLMTDTGSLRLAIVEPVYNRTAECEGTASNGTCVEGSYWGHSRTFYQLSTGIAALRTLEGADTHDIQLRSRNLQTGAIMVVMNWTRLPEPSTLVDHGTERDTEHVVGLSFMNPMTGDPCEWVVVTKRHGGFTQTNDSRAIAGAVLGSIAAGVFAVILIVLIAAIVERLSRREASGPLQGPLAVVVLEIDDTSVPWALDPAAASETINRMMAACRKEAARRNAYPAQLVGDGMMVVATTPDAAIAFAEAMNEWAEDNDWPESLQNEQKVKPLRLRVAVHWGRDIMNRTPEEDRAEYVGADADYAVGMRSLCPCTRVTVTPSLRRAALKLNKDAAKNFVPLGLTLPSEDGLVYGAYVVRSARDGAALEASSLTIDDDDRRMWNFDADPEPTLPASAMSHDMLLESNAPGGDQLIGNVNPGASSEHVGQQRASARGVAAWKQRQIDLALSHAAFTQYAHPPWLPARACEVQEVQKLHALLQDHITTPDEANHYSALLTVATYNYQAFSFMLGPLTAVERNNVARRLQSAFGVPERGFLQRLAVHTAIVAFRALPMPPSLAPPVSAMLDGDATYDNNTLGIDGMQPQGSLNGPAGGMLRKKPSVQSPQQRQQHQLQQPSQQQQHHHQQHQQQHQQQQQQLAQQRRQQAQQPQPQPQRQPQPQPHHHAAPTQQEQHSPHESHDPPSRAQEEGGDEDPESDGEGFAAPVEAEEPSSAAAAPFTSLDM